MDFFDSNLTGWENILIPQDIYNSNFSTKNLYEQVTLKQSWQIKIFQVLKTNVHKISLSNSKNHLNAFGLGWPNQTSIFEDPQPHPQKLRFFEAEDQLFKNIWGFLRMRVILELWGLWGFNLNKPQNLRWGWGQDFWGFLRILEKPRKNWWKNP